MSWACILPADYATVHGLFGCAVCWGYLLLLILYPVLGGHNEQGWPYIYSQFYGAWSLGRALSAAKVFTTQTLVLVPVTNALYWCVIWAVRRARVSVGRKQ